MIVIYYFVEGKRVKEGVDQKMKLHRIIATLTTKPVIAALTIVALLATTTSAIAMVVSIAAVTEIQPETANSGAVQPPHGTTSSSVTAASNNSLSTKSRPSEGGQADATASLGGFANGKLNSSNLVNNNLAKANKAATAASTSTINSITLAKAGTGLDGEGGSNNTVLINNSAKWHMVLNLSAGTTTVTVEFPKGNVIENASVSSAAGCTDGSKLEKTNGSYTNNKATCVIKTDSPKSQSWDIVDYVFGGNGQKLAPTKVTINGNDYTGTIPAVTLKGKANYSLQLYQKSNNDGNYSLPTSNAQWNNSFVLDLNIIPNGDAIGRESLSDTAAVRLETSSLPTGWKISRIYNYSGCGSSISYKRASDGSYLDITYSDMPLASRCEMYSRIQFSVPMSAISDNGTKVTVSTTDSEVATISGTKYTLKGGSSASDTLQNHDVFSYGLWKWGTTGAATIMGVSYDINERTSTDLVSSDYNTNLYACTTVAANKQSITGFTAGWGAKAEYGVIGTDVTAAPSPKDTCGKYGDKSANFFGNLSDAQAYAKQHGGAVNAVRSYIAKMSTGNNFDIGQINTRITADPQYIGQWIHAKMYISTDQWQGSGDTNFYGNQAISEGYTDIASFTASNNLSISPSANPGVTQHFTVKYGGLGKEGNVYTKIELPSSLTYIEGSARYEGSSITPTYTSTNNGVTTIEFKIGTIGQSYGESVDPKPELTFDANVNGNVATPSTISVNTWMKGDAQNWYRRSRSTSFSVAKTTSAYGYNLSQSNAVLLPGDDQTYNFTSYNNPDDAHADKTMAVLSILPYNGDKNGTKNVEYTGTTVKLADPNLDISGLTGYYTTDTEVRNVDLSDQSATNSILSNKEIWHKISLSDTEQGIALPDDTTAIMWVDAKATKDRLISFYMTLNNVRSTASGAKLANAINYVTVTGSLPIVNPITQTADVADTTVNISLDKVLADLSEKGATGALSTTSTITATTNSARGYSLTMKAKSSSSLVNSSASKYTISTSNSAAPKSLATNTWGYALPDQTDKGFGSIADYTNPTSTTTFAKVPSSTDDAVVIKSTTNRPDQTTGDATKVAYGINLGNNNTAGTYKTEIVYTVTANPFE